MIWYFIAGWISGAVAMVMYANYWVHKHSVVVKIPPVDKEEKENENNE